MDRPLTKRESDELLARIHLVLAKQDRPAPKERRRISKPRRLAGGCLLYRIA